MSKPELIVMLTHHDKTVHGAKEIFLAAKDAPAVNWGFKDVGVPKEEMLDLIAAMKAAGKKTYIECLAFDEPSALNAMNLAIECGFDVAMGTFYFDSVGQLAMDHGIDYYPFTGDLREGLLYGTIDEVIKATVDVAKKKVTGVDLCGYRYMDGDPDEMIKAVSKAVFEETGKPTFCVGSIDSFHRLDVVKEAGVSGFTIGGAFFEEKFGKTFSEQIKVVDDYLNK